MNNHVHSYAGDATDLFRLFASDHNIEPPSEIIANGLMQRPKINGKQNIAYILHDDGRPSGFIQDFQQGLKLIWKATVERKTYKLRAIE